MSYATFEEQQKLMHGKVGRKFIVGFSDSFPITVSAYKMSVSAHGALLITNEHCQVVLCCPPGGWVTAREVMDETPATRS